MKRKSLYSRLRAALGAVLQYWGDHADSLAAMKKLYVREYADEKGGPCKVILGISSYGSLFRITQVFYNGGVYSREENWLASYGWHFNGHLTALGRGTCYLMFNPLHRSVCLEIYNDADERILEHYTQI
ncbi:hypothetical protein SAMN05216464_11854 [Mucilaginibacter pineti]|uniref:Uncharacterized protein n=1 Tax=Mucilaginibacter pineti TaxID=1391627 RepID=A0A1G7L6A0_9SPHI|nr:hypothetical protein [Mucilaginibacter pineti]SDF45008.1 hypothetical protein SAMN05216464_11854 [Mucilaginibacter pineti]